MSSTTANRKGERGKVRRSRRWLFRLAAIVVGLLPVAVVELTLRGLDWPAQPLPLDPYLDLHNLRPLFRSEPASDGGQRMVVPDERLHLFNRVSFAVEKSPNAFRIFALGGSTTFGEPYSAPSAFPKWLELYLQAAAPERQVEVINCGGLSYASYRVLAILKEVVDYRPDLIVVYTGHNEYLERRSYGDSQAWRPIAALTGWLSQLRIVQVARSALGAEALSPANAGQTGDTSQDRTVMEAEVDALLDYQNGLEAYHRDSPWLQSIPDHFEWNLQAMREVCRRADVPLLLVRPVSNLRDCPPFKMEIDPGLAPDELADFDEAWIQTRSAADINEAITWAGRAMEIDPGHAGVHFLLGRRLLEIGDTQAAVVHLIQAKDCDVCPLRAPSAILRAIDTVSIGGQGVPIVDAAALFRELSPNGIVGDQWLVDHIHPSVEGHRLLGEAIADEVLQQGWIGSVGSDWRERAELSVEQHRASLGEDYYQRGRQRLEGLLLWTQGRAKKIRSSTE